MSRPDSNSPQSFPSLSRRAVLPGIAAAPTVLAAATGQAFSFPKAIGVVDPRLDEFAALADEFHAALTAELDSTLERSSEEQTLDEKRVHDADDAIDAFVSMLDPKLPADLGIRAKVAEWRYARRDDDLAQDSWIYDLIQANLAVAGIAPLKESPFRVGYDDTRIKTWVDEPDLTPRSDCKPDSIAAGEDIAELRRLSQRHIEALECEARLDGNAPQHKETCENTSRCLQDLCDFGETLKSKVARCYSQRDGFVVLGNLVVAIDDVYLEGLEEEVAFFGAEARIEGHRNGVLRTLIELARKDGDKLVREAACWNASQGGANV